MEILKNNIVLCWCVAAWYQTDQLDKNHVWQLGIKQTNQKTLFVAAWGQMDQADNPICGSCVSDTPIIQHYSWKLDIRRTNQTIPFVAA